MPFVVAFIIAAAVLAVAAFLMGDRRRTWAALGFGLAVSTTFVIYQAEYGPGWAAFLWIGFGWFVIKQWLRMDALAGYAVLSGLMYAPILYFRFIGLEAERLMEIASDAFGVAFLICLGGPLVSRLLHSSGGDGHNGWSVRSWRLGSMADHRHAKETPQEEVRR